MAKSKLVGDTTSVGRLAIAVLGGFGVFALVSLVTGGLFPFLEVALSAAAVYFIARR